jgi:hypothetical protein
MMPGLFKKDLTTQPYYSEPVAVKSCRLSRALWVGNVGDHRGSGKRPIESHCRPLHTYLPSTF